MGRETTASPRRAQAADKRRQALELRLEGATFEQIAEQIGYRNRSTAYRAVTSAIQNVGHEQAEQLRDLDLTRLDKLMTAVWPKALQGDMHAVDRVLKIVERRAKMLGYDQANVVSINSMRADTVADTTTPSASLRDVLGEVGETTQHHIARIIHQHIPTIAGGGDENPHVIDAKPGA